VVVIVFFLVYLLLPPKKGYHPVYGYRTLAKNPILVKLGGLLDKVKEIGSIKRPSFRKDQTTLSRFEKPYQEGYKKAESLYKGKEGLADKLKKKVKK
jgi:hypothetical protein